MYKILIAEDSKPILRNIKELLLTSGLPVQVVHTASNGADALEGVLSREVDILITDIRMPKLDGLAMIEEAKKAKPGLKVILISGYNDFEYTRKAINLQVTDYLLKPVERPALVEVMERVIVQLGEEHRKEFAVLDGILDPSFSQELTLPPGYFRNKKLVLVLHRQFFRGAVSGFLPGPVQELLNLSFAPHSFRVFAANKPNQLLVLTDPSFIDGSVSPMERLEQIGALLEDEGLPASIAGQFIPAAANEIAGCCHSLSGLLGSRISIAKTCLLDAAHPAGQGIEASEDVERIGARFTDKIQKLQKEPFLRQLEEQLLKWGRTNVRVAQLQRFTALLANAFAAHQQDRNGKNDWAAYMAEVQPLFECPSYGEFCSGLLALLEGWFTETQSLNKKGGYELFSLIDAYLKANLYSQVSMNELSAAFHVSPSYISRVVKKYSNSTLMQYYLDLKIAEARKVMQSNPAIKIKELSDALCFYDQHYFSKVFKEYAGCNPSEYKTMLKGG
ncbi:response regulator [Paenibacillus sp. N4]|uniref:response regulator transcription factor n=1 Tax=Paenibacillus vietnamensis TaxID=2590547 RepID=UPI001CD05CD7|nr:response regulator [Paenibacillus vietnamensis]MCA0758083.1 response regulator [Paenibacillus vietnamensis]